MNAPRPASLAIFCKGQRQLAFLDKKSGEYHCQCCGVRVSVAW